MTVRGTAQNPKRRNEVRRPEISCRLAGKLHGHAFGVDVAFGDPILGEPETVAVATQMRRACRCELRATLSKPLRYIEATPPHQGTDRRL
jgi:hypothetical protein